MAASCESTDPTITRIMNPGRGCGVLKAGERKRSFPVDCRLKKSRYEVVTLQQAGADLPVRLAQCERKLILEIVGFLREPSDARFLAVKGVSEKAYYSCLRALGTADPDSPLADHIASSLASLAVIRDRFDRAQLSALLSNGSLSLPTLR